MQARRRPRRTTGTAVLVLTLLAGSGVDLFAQRGRGAPPPAPRDAAPVDLTGYWVSVVTEDWRYRMVTPAHGDYQGVPMTPEAVEVADAWDPEADEAAGEACRSYGAPALLRVPGRLHVTWVDADTLSLEADAGMQARIFRFGTPDDDPGEPTWQGVSVAEWQQPGRRGGPAPGEARHGSLKVVTRNLRAGYLRKNGVPYSEDAVLTEYFNVARRENGEEWLVVVSVVEDARYLRQPFIVSTHFKRQADAAGWDPTPCSATW